MKTLVLSVCTKDHIAIFGGRIKTEILPDFLKITPGGLLWSIGEHPDRCEILKEQLPELKYLERLRLFGPGGDLELRREDDAYRWRFIGPAGSKFDRRYQLRDFWAETGIQHLCRHDETLLLWGEKRGDRYYDGRFAAARLVYPLGEHTNKKRAVIKTRIYTYFGRPQFAWYYSLEEWEADEREN
ncbi:hypothetical protein P378_01955 [Desulforamulus profundi]|uniref:Uncharacterized protein n=1 Tax=Desulforamulus profundi TaxID=1383067 RepID=A0A2C6LM11_9FIRM|nr:hypothetical protein [Desulforamulus profundi]PHJ39630.1 hypothetical protein P378_01955 [Desulforamulus profundi]